MTGRMLVAFLLFLTPAAPALGAEPVGSVERVQGTASAVTGGVKQGLDAGDPVHQGALLLTGAGSRLAVTFADGTSLTLGENAALEVDEMIYDGGADDSVAMDVLAGAFLFATGEIGVASPESVIVTTPVSTIGIRGTQFWGGPIDEAYGVLILEGAVVISNAAGSVTLDEVGEGTSIAGPDAAPDAPRVWPESKTARAIATVAFDR